MNQKSKKFWQENVVALNKEVFLLKKKFAELVTISSMISGLKQEAHLADLVNISISYVRELRKSSKAKQDATSRNKSMKTRNMSFVIGSHPHFSNSTRSNSVAISGSGKHMRNKWFETLSSISMSKEILEADDKEQNPTRNESEVSESNEQLNASTNCNQTVFLQESVSNNSGHSKQESLLEMGRLESDLQPQSLLTLNDRWDF